MLVLSVAETDLYSFSWDSVLPSKSDLFSVEYYNVGRFYRCVSSGSNAVFINLITRKKSNESDWEEQMFDPDKTNNVMSMLCPCSWRRLRTLASFAEVVLRRRRYSAFDRVSAKADQRSVVLTHDCKSVSVSKLVPAAHLFVRPSDLRQKFNGTLNVFSSCARIKRTRWES